MEIPRLQTVRHQAIDVEEWRGVKALVFTDLGGIPAVIDGPPTKTRWQIRTVLAAQSRRPETLE